MGRVIPQYVYRLTPENLHTSKRKRKCVSRQRVAVNAECCKNANGEGGA